VKARVAFLISLLIGYSCCPAWAQISLDFPEEPLRLIAESAMEPCSICARQMREKAIELLEDQFPAGKLFTTTGFCRLARTALAEENELIVSCDFAVAESLPLLTFRFHTQDAHLVGISPADFTEAEIVSEYRLAPPGTVFEGTLEPILFRYGDGPTFSYSASREVVQIHCRLRALKKRSAEHAGPNLISVTKLHDQIHE
jgi:hypothetical protein